MVTGLAQIRYVVILAVILAVTPSFAQTTNDNCNAADPISLPFGPTSQTNNGEPETFSDSTCGITSGYYSLWYTPAISYNQVHRVTGSSKNTSMDLAVFSGSCGGLTCEDHTGSFFSDADLEVALTSETLYYLVVHSASIGTLDLAWEDITATNSECSNATDITGSWPYSSSPDSSGGFPIGFTSVGCDISSDMRGLWYQVTPEATILLRVAVYQSSFSSSLSIFSGTCGSLACQQSSGSHSFSDIFLSFEAEESTTYYILVTGQNFDQAGTFQFLVDVPIANAQCSTATDITGSLDYYSATEDNSGGLTGFTSGSCSVSADMRGVWYQLTPSTNSNLSATVSSQTFSASISVYTGSCGTLTCETSTLTYSQTSDRTVDFQADAATTYYILVTGEDFSEAGTFALSVSDLTAVTPNPTLMPSGSPTLMPDDSPTLTPDGSPTLGPSDSPTPGPSDTLPSQTPVQAPTQAPAANAECSTATDLSCALPFSGTESIIGASSSFSNTECNINTDARGVWYEIAPEIGGAVVVEVQNQEFDASISVYIGSCGDLVCLDSTAYSSVSRRLLQFSVVASNTYHILITSSNATDAGSFDLSVSGPTCSSPTPNPTPNINEPPIARPTNVQTQAPFADSTQPCACFSGENTVEIWNKGQVPISTLSIGDYVRTNDNAFSRVYSFSHLDRQQRTLFLQLYLNGTAIEYHPLEISEEHLIFVAGKGVVRARDIEIGDKISCGSAVETVAYIDRVWRRGVYAPLTYSGIIMINGIKASSYVALGDFNDELQHYITHVALTPHRIFCWFHFNECQGEKYSREEGVSLCLVGVFRFIVRVRDHLDLSPRAQLWLSVALLPVVLVYLALKFLLLSKSLFTLFFAVALVAILHKATSLVEKTRERYRGLARSDLRRKQISEFITFAKGTIPVR